MGQRPSLMVADLDMVKQILVKEFDNFMDRPVSDHVTLVGGHMTLMGGHVTLVGQLNTPSLSHQPSHNDKLMVGVSLSSCSQHFPDLLRKKPGSPRGLLSAKGEAWKRARQTLSPTFSALKIKMVGMVLIT